jgi:hypothetical protein
MLDAAGIDLVAVGFEAHGLQSFVDGQFFDGDIYVDLTRASYKSLGLQNLGFVRDLWLAPSSPPALPQPCPGGVSPCPSLTACQFVCAGVFSFAAWRRC